MAQVAVMSESWLERAARLLLDAAAEAQADNADTALVIACAAVEALRIEMGELPEPDDV